MTMKTMNNVFTKTACLTLVMIMALFSTDASAQKSERVLAPGVLTTIAPAIEEGETYSSPADLIEISKARVHLKWKPNFSPSTRTLFERSLKVPLRRNVWGLEFTFKPFRMVDVDVPQASGKMQRKTIWYMVYRVRYLGEEVHFQSQPESPPLSKRPIDSRYTLFNNIRKDAQFRYFIPYFTLRSHLQDKEYLDRLIPSAIDEIAAIEKVPGPLLNSVQMANTKIDLEDAESGKGVWGVVMWEDVDPRTNFFSLYVQGLTNAYRYEDTAEAPQVGDEIAAGRVIELKTLQLNFYRPGDTIELTKDSIFYGLPNAVPRPEIIYTTESGDNLKSLAKRFLSDESRALEIYQLNRDVLSTPNKLPVGTLIRFPRNNHERYNDLVPVRLHTVVVGETLDSISRIYDIQVLDLQRVNADYIANGEEPDAGDLVMVPVNLNRLNRPENAQKDIYKIYTLRQVAIMRLYGMNKFGKNQWIYTGTNSPVFRTAETPKTTEIQAINK
ncbi:MAG: LysM peptidoglycan-binding domain-containing protein [Planctomycetota bacterium]|nr:LysM peptidoglycan-binding domain-containing protein [Planctomycetota bacterium]